MSAAAIGDWREVAECAVGGYDPELWYAGDGAFRERQAAIAICRRCPVRAECLAAALATPWDDDHGIWGGLSRKHRRKLRKLPAPRREVVASEGSQRRLRALAHLGWGIGDVRDEIRKATGDAPGPVLLGEIRLGEALYVEPPLHEAIARAYALLSTWHSESSGGGQSRGLARRHGWPTVEAWAGVDIDDPRALPRIPF